MRVNVYYIFFLGSLLLGNNTLNGQGVVYVGNGELMDISSQLETFHDTTKNLSIDEVVDQEFIGGYTTVPNLGISEEHFWVRLSVTNQSKLDNLVMDLSIPIMDYIEFYSPVDDGFEVSVVGDAFPYNQRKYNDPHFLFDIDIPQGETKTYYMKVWSNEAIQLPIKIGSKTHVFDELKTRDVLTGIYCGIMLVMIFYNLFLYSSVRDKSYLYYTIYILCILLTQTSLQGYTLQYLWPNNPDITKFSLIFLPSLSGITGLHFMSVFLQTKNYYKWLYRLSFILMLPYVFAMLLSLTGVFSSSQGLIQLNSGLISLYMLIIPIMVYRRGFKPAKYFIAAWSVFLVGVIVFILKDAGVLPFNNLTRYTMQIGSGIETILLSFALAARINVYKKERLEALEENEKLIREQNIVLERTVDERTAELNQTLLDLKKAQSQLVEAEKMSSLGQLTAGIAHEINNPINFVSSNIIPLRNDIDDLKTILKKYEEISKEGDIQNTIIEVEELKKKLDYEYLQEELNTIINGIEDGAKRTTQIVSGLRNFSRLDEGELKLCDINEGINSTLILIKNKINNIKIKTNLIDKAECECNPGKINQVIMNLIDNAIYTINKKYDKDSEGLITISTQNEQDNVIVTIEDNGLGIPDENLMKLYDPFFTTKDVGEGTGLGLSIVKGIIDSHNGKIEVISSFNEGTKVVVRIPKIKANGKN